MATSTRQDVRERMIDAYRLGRRGTNTGTSTSTITDVTNFGGHGRADGIDVGCDVLITSGGAAPEDEIRAISGRPVLATGVMTVSPVFSAALANTDTFEVLYSPLRYDGGEFSVHEAIRQAQRLYAWERRVVPISLVADADMLKAGVTDWTMSSSGSRAKTAASFPLGLRALSVTVGAAQEQAQSASIPVEEDTNYYLEVTGAINPTTGDAADEGQVVLRDMTNAANITLANKTIDRFEPEILVNGSVAMPSGCKQVQVWLLGMLSGDVIDWGNVIFRKNSAREFTTQDRPIRIERLGKLLVPSSDQWADRGRMIEVEATLQQVGNGIWQYHTRQSLAGESVWYEEFTVPVELDADTDTTTIPVDELAAVSSAILLKPLRIRSKDWAMRYEDAASDAVRARQQYMDQIGTVRSETQWTYPLYPV